MHKNITKTLAALAIFVFPGLSLAAKKQLHPNEIHQVVKPHTTSIRRCYERYAKKKKKSNAPFVLSFVIAKDGNVASFSTDAKAKNKQRFRRCLGKEVNSFDFSQLRNPTEIQYPFYFQQTYARGAGPRNK